MHSIHDFTAKLRQPSLRAHVDRYVQWRRAVEQARRTGQQEPKAPALAPISINLDLTTACNYRCTHCIDWDILNTKHKHREAELRAAMAQMAETGLRSVILIGGGEPTLYPGFADFVAYLKQLRLQVAIVSNGSRGDRLLAAAAHMAEQDWIRLSLDSGSNELFRAMHKPVDPKCDLDAICSWIPKIKAANPAVRCGFSYIITWQGSSREENALHENIHEIAMAAERAKAAGFDYIAFKPVLERQSDGAEVMDPGKTASDLAEVIARIRAEVDRAKRIADERFSVYESTNLRVLEQGNWRDFTRQPRTCHMQSLRQVLTPTGVYNCPAHRGVEKAKIGEAAAYAGEERAQETAGAVGAILDRFDASHECREVTCLYNGVNWWLEKLVHDPSADAEIEPSPERGDFFL
jgi:sulfatase maturation enzyme AslB (radical SAM superfamily)